MIRPEHSDLLGNRVVVNGPYDTWHGTGIAISYDPVILIETDDGRRLMVSLSWAKPAPELDPKPWICTSCSDRFVREQKGPTTHVTKFKPRSCYSQDREDYA